MKTKTVVKRSFESTSKAMHAKASAGHASGVKVGKQIKRQLQRGMQQGAKGAGAARGGITVITSWLSGIVSGLKS